MLSIEEILKIAEMSGVTCESDGKGVHKILSEEKELVDFSLTEEVNLET